MSILDKTLCKKGISFWSAFLICLHSISHGGEISLDDHTRARQNRLQVWSGSSQPDPDGERNREGGGGRRGQTGQTFRSRCWGNPHSNRRKYIWPWRWGEGWWGLSCLQNIARCSASSVCYIWSGKKGVDFIVLLH